MLLGASEPTPRDRAMEALRLEFRRDGVGATRATLDESFRAACTEGYLPVCDPARWRPDDRSTFASLEAVFAPPCAKGDPTACTVMGWIADAAARAAAPTEQASLYRQAARMWKGACDVQKFAPACHEYAGQLYEQRGVKAESAAAIARWERSCSAGYGPSCTTLAVLHTAGGRSGKPDVKKALSYAEKACDGGDVAGCAARDALVPPADPLAAASALCDRGLLASCRAAIQTDLDKITNRDDDYRTLGRMCDLGAGDACGMAGRIAIAGADADGAFDRFAMGCRQDHADSCVRLAQATDADPTAVLRQPDAFRIACFLAESDQACTTWGSAMVEGTIPRDGPAARRALERACEETTGGGACAALALGFEAGRVGERDRTLAARYYGWACAQDAFESCERRGDLLIEAVGVRRDDDVALASFSRACEGGRPSGCYKAGRVLDLGTDIDRNRIQALELYRRGCAGGVADACYSLGRLHEEAEEEVKPDYGAAREAYELAVSGGSLEARSALCRLLWNGLGGPQKRVRARDLAAEACQRGDRRACQGPSFL